jgi:hypothetical protein
MNLRAASLLLAVMVAADVQYFRYERPVVQTPSQPSQTCVSLDAAIFAHSRAALSDLRLYRDGSETAYALRVAATVTAPAGNIGIRNLGEQNGRLVFDAAMPDGLYKDIELDLEAHDFVATAEVVGGHSQAGEAATKIGTYTIFDFTRERLGRSTILHLPESDFRYLHFRIDGPLRPDDVKGLNVVGAREAKQDYVTVAETAQLTQKDRDTVVEFSLPANVPVERVEFVPVAEPPNFSRDVTVTVAAEKNSRDDGREEEPYISYGSILRLHNVRGGHHIDEERLSVDTPASAMPRPTKWVVKVENGDDMPLSFQAIRLQMLARTLCFEAAPGATYTLYYGDPSLAAPRYDYATLFALSSDAARAALGPEKDNPDYKPRPDQRPFTERHPALLWTALVLVVALLGGIALRSAKQVQER